MESKFTVGALFVHPHKDCVGECESDLTYKEAMKIYKDWLNQPNKYKDVFYEEQGC